ncbi:hypothetical protein [Wenzhouxiangella sp. XN24]|uniref:hypothetical protein n=1 Tax=Wenzhouxiangella sp. XN24 TaxID=2713569 RepID=UPI0013E9D784|nr:hypothetical protein [Wenzhouxiangella sp. XN24]NGX16882.1 hypothetical protein [Wenzhouxiangella sp. XN24]
MPRRLRFFLPGLAATCCLWAPVSHGHALLHEVLDGEAVIVRLTFAGGDESPWFEPYEVFAPGEETAFQSGRVNALGEVTFRPDRAGAWKLRVISADGHGATITLEVGDAGDVLAVQEAQGNAHGHWSRVFAALGYVLGLFGLLMVWRQSRARPPPAA